MPGCDQQNSEKYVWRQTTPVAAGPIKTPIFFQSPFTPIQEERTVAYSINSTVAELLDNPATLAFIEKNMAELPNHPMLGMIMNMPLKALAPFSEGKLTDEVLAQIDAELAKL